LKQGIWMMSFTARGGDESSQMALCGLAQHGSGILG
jgi:hypothetical protein